MDTALLVIDMQNGFCHPDGSLPRFSGPLPDMAAVVERAADLIAGARAAGMPVIYTRHVYRPGLTDASARARALMPPDGHCLIRGTWDADVLDELRPAADDLVIDKNRYDAFLYTDLDALLRARGIARVLVCGVITSVCVETTVRSAEQRGYDCYVAEDATTSPPGTYEPSLAMIGMAFATVGEGRDLLTDLTRPLAPASAY